MTSSDGSRIPAGTNETSSGKQPYHRETLPLHEVLCLLRARLASRDTLPHNALHAKDIVIREIKLSLAHRAQIEHVHVRDVREREVG